MADPTSLASNRPWPPIADGSNSHRVGRRLLLWILPLLLLTAAACARIGNPEGWSGGVIVDDLLFIGTPKGEVIALERESGERKWRFELRGEEKERAVYGTPTLAGGTLYVGGYDGILYALNLEGELKWQERVGVSTDREGDPIVGSPVVADGLVIVGSSDGNLYAFDVDDQSEEWRFATSDKIWSTPAVVDGVVYFGSLDHKVYAVSLLDGSKVWEFQTKGAVAAGPVVVRGRVYVGSFDSVFYAIDAQTGKEAWRFTEANNWFWGRAIASEGTIYVPSLDGNLYALDLASGGLLWTLETEGALVGSPAFVGDMIAVPSVDGRIRLVRLTDGTLQDSCNIGEKIRTPLLQHEGIIYFAARDRSIRALRIKPNGNPDEKWVHFTNKDEPLPQGRAPAC